MKVKITERVATVGDLRKFLERLDRMNVSDDEKLNPEKSRLIAESQKENLADQELSKAYPTTANFLKMAAAAQSPATKMASKIEAALKAGVVLWIEKEEE